MLMFYVFALIMYIAAAVMSKCMYHLHFLFLSAHLPCSWLSCLCPGGCSISTNLVAYCKSIRVCKALCHKVNFDVFGV